MNVVVAPTMMQIWCEYGECSSNCSGDIVLTRCNDREGQGHDFEGEGQGHP